MIPSFRAQFNAQFTEAKYQAFLRALDDAAGTKIDFRVCETPVFLPKALLQELQQAAMEIIGQLNTPEYLRESGKAVPERYRVPNEDSHPLFVQVDFAVTLDENGKLAPKLIELQGFPSLYGFQIVLTQTFQRMFDLSHLEFLLGGITKQRYVDLLKRALLGKHDPENVILMEIDPEKQKTACDFVCTERFTGVKPVNITEIKKRGKKLFYLKNAKETPIHRVYNRVIVDEFIKKNIACDFDFCDELEVEWAGHPNWYFRMSKFSLPHLRHPAVPRAYFLDQLERYPQPLENYVLKPLFSFAGSGVKIDVTPADLDAISPADRPFHLLQEKIEYGPVIKTPDAASKVEVRMMFLWLDKPMPVTTLARLSQGKMLGVDFNKNKTWVGASCCLFER
ncbi:MAG: hypothetical protein ACREOI_12350 [bacterium]